MRLDTFAARESSWLPTSAMAGIGPLRGPGGDIMEISARNQLRGTLKEIRRGAVMGEVVVDIGGQSVTASITLASIERLGLRPGDGVVAIVKATDVMIGK